MECPACGEAYLLPEPLAQSGTLVRCPGCRGSFPAAEPASVAACALRIEEWARAQGGLDAVRAARREGRLWRAFGASLLALGEAEGERFPSETWQAALAKTLGPGRPLF